MILPRGFSRGPSQDRFAVAVFSFFQGRRVDGLPVRGGAG